MQGITEVRQLRASLAFFADISTRRKERRAVCYHGRVGWQSLRHRQRQWNQVLYQGRAEVRDFLSASVVDLLTRRSAAEITIQIKNQGEEAYKPKEYGKSIYITRRFTKDGGSTWKIKGKDGRVISTKKEELSAICDHMNIQVDNPMNVLTQGRSSVYFK